MKAKIIIVLVSVLLGGIGGVVIDSVLLNQSGASKTVYDHRTASTAEDQEKNEQLAKSQKSNEALEKDAEEDEKLIRQQSAARIDYPLIDLYFDKEKEYKVVIKEFGNEENIYKEYVDTGDFFQFNKEQFSITTVPSGRGTTTKYVLNVYEEDQCIKTMDCIGIRTDFSASSGTDRHKNNTEAGTASLVASFLPARSLDFSVERDRFQSVVVIINSTPENGYRGNRAKIYRDEGILATIQTINNMDIYPKEESYEYYGGKTPDVMINFMNEKSRVIESLNIYLDLKLNEFVFEYHEKIYKINASEIDNFHEICEKYDEEYHDKKSKD